MMRFSKRLILGSASPRRRELLEGLGIPFTVDTRNTFEESMDGSVPPRAIPSLMSEGKSLGFHRPLDDDEVLITSDTVVIAGDSVLGKPHFREEAEKMLELLSSRTHEVVTAVTLRDSSHYITFSDATYVTFKALTKEEIAYYIDSCSPFDKAGAYGIQEWIGYIGITGIEGSFYNVMGFPVHRVYEELGRFCG